MRYHRDDVVARALEVLDTYGLGDLTMRRLGTELGVQPSALLPPLRDQAAPARGGRRRILTPAGARPAPSGGTTASQAVCSELRDAVLAYRRRRRGRGDVMSFGLGPRRRTTTWWPSLAEAGLDPSLVPTAAPDAAPLRPRARDRRADPQAGSAGAIDGEPLPESDFVAGLGLVLDGIRRCAPEATPWIGRESRKQRS